MPRKTRRTYPKGMFEESFIFIKNGEVQKESNLNAVVTPDKIIYTGEENGKPLKGEILMHKPKKSKKTKSRKRSRR